MLSLFIYSQTYALEANDFTNVKNLEGGILAWAQTIDPDLLVKLL